MEARVASGEPGDTDTANYAVFDTTGTAPIALTHPKANIAIGTYVRESGSHVRPYEADGYRAWDTVPSGCKRRRRDLLAGGGCSDGVDGGGSSNSGGATDDGVPDNGRDCNYRWVRGSNGQLVRRKICTSSG